MSNRIITPWSQPPSKVEITQESIVDLVVKFTKERVDECLKDLNGGLLPDKKVLKKKLACVNHTDGRMFYWKGRPMVYISNPKLDNSNGKMQVHIIHRRMYGHDVAKN